MDLALIFLTERRVKLHTLSQQLVGGVNATSRNVAAEVAEVACSIRVSGARVRVCVCCSANQRNENQQRTARAPVCREKYYGSNRNYAEAKLCEL